MWVALIFDSVMSGSRIYGLAEFGGLSCYLLALWGRAGSFTKANPLALSMKRALGKPLGKDPRIHSKRIESLLNSMLVPPIVRI